ncbi:MAG: hypothetical protein QG599_792 [Pseudomonadota bacterium]|nr:hypothetical protein [Pseudomonadota bacterium]
MQPRYADQFKQFLYSIYYLPKLPIANSAYSAQIGKILMNIARSVFHQTSPRSRTDISFGMSHIPAVGRRLDTMLMQQFQVSIPKATNSIDRG